MTDSQQYAIIFNKLADADLTIRELTWLISPDVLDTLESCHRKAISVKELAEIIKKVEGEATELALDHLKIEYWDYIYDLVKKHPSNVPQQD